MLKQHRIVIVILCAAVIIPSGIFVFAELRPSTELSPEPPPVTHTPTSPVPDQQVTSTPKRTVTTRVPTPTPGITLEQAAKLMPLAPGGVTVEARRDEINLKWRGTGESIVEYEILRKTDSAEAFQPIASVNATEENRGWYEWTDKTTIQATKYIYGVRAIKTITFNTKSSISESSSISLN